MGWQREAFAQPSEGFPGTTLFQRLSKPRCCEYVLKTAHRHLLGPRIHGRPVPQPKQPAHAELLASQRLTSAPAMIARGAINEPLGTRWVGVETASPTLMVSPAASQNMKHNNFVCGCTRTWIGVCRVLVPYRLYRPCPSYALPFPAPWPPLLSDLRGPDKLCDPGHPQVWGPSVCKVQGLGFKFGARLWQPHS